jgi:thymidylate synthase ThyX
MRHTDMGRANLRMPVTIAEGSERDRELWERTNKEAVSAYQSMCIADIPYEDARTVLPLATETWIIAGMPMRTWLETYEYRACYMFYPEMRWVFQRMKEELARHNEPLSTYAQITCERRKICTYRGAEDTAECPLRKANGWDREWQSPEYDDRMLRLRALGQ